MFAVFGTICAIYLPGDPTAEYTHRRSAGDEGVTTRPSSPWVVEEFEVTSYCACSICCGSDSPGITASGYSVRENHGRFISAPKRFKFGTAFRIPGYHNGDPVPVLDRGGAITGNHIEVFFPLHSDARKWGRQILQVQYLKGQNDENTDLR